MGFRSLQRPTGERVADQVDGLSFGASSAPVPTGLQYLLRPEATALPSVQPAGLQYLLRPEAIHAEALSQVPRTDSDANLTKRMDNDSAPGDAPAKRRKAESLSSLAFLMGCMIQAHPRSEKLVENLVLLNALGIDLGTMCSGTDCPLLAVSATAAWLNAEFRRRSVTTSVRATLVISRFACEADAEVRAWILANWRPPKIFTDVCRLVTFDHRATCAVAGTAVPVDTVSVSIAGTSCKRFSSACSSAGRATPASLHDVLESNSSIDTLKGFMQYTEVHGSSLTMIENVPLTAQADANGLSTRDLVESDWRRQGRHARDALINGNTFVPEHRDRIYLWSHRSSADREQEIQAGLAAMKTAAAQQRLALDAYLLPPNPAYLERLLTQAIAARDQNLEDGFGGKWTEDHEARQLELQASGNWHYIDSVAMLAEFSAWPGAQAFTPREKSIVKLKIGQHGRSLEHGVFDISQSECRSCARFDGDLPCIMPNRKYVLWRLGAKRSLSWLSGWELLKVQMAITCEKHLMTGFPRIRHFSDALLHRLAGNSFCCPAFACAFLAVIGAMDKADIESLKS